VRAPRWLRLWSGLLVVAVLVAACSDDDGGADAASDDDAATESSGSVTTTTAAPDTTVEVEQFSGTVDEFYEVPDPLPAGEPGDLIRTMPVEAPEGEAGLRIMYHSTDAGGADRAVTGVVYHPTGEAPDGGWPILAWAHGTSGMAAPCAPSRDPWEPPGFGVEGVRVATDYLGLGPVGELHPYLSASAEGHAMVDSVAAVRALPDVEAGDRWVAAGVSQGGHAALVTNEMAAERLPDVELLGTVAIAPGAQLSQTYGDDIQTRIISAMVLFGAAAEDPAIDPQDYLAPEVYPAAKAAVEDSCLSEVIADLLPFAGTADFFTTDPRTDPVGLAWLEENDPGQVAAPSPLLLVQGGRDAIVVPARTEALYERLCGIGQVVERIDVPEADHDTVTGEADEQIRAWIADRFAGEPAVDDC
jgi:pimeloyl-ACP methyl ester carboxylesterase